MYFIKIYTIILEQNTTPPQPPSATILPPAPKVVRLQQRQADPSSSGSRSFFNLDSMS